MCVVAREAVRAPVAVGGVVWACTAQPARACQAVHGAWGPVRFRGCVDLCLCSVPRHVGTCVLGGGPLRLGSVGLCVQPIWGCVHKCV